MATVLLSAAASLVPGGRKKGRGRGKTWGELGGLRSEVQIKGVTVICWRRLKTTQQMWKLESNKNNLGVMQKANH